MAMANPADAMKEIQKEMQEKFDESGMGKVEEFADTMDDMVTKLKAGPTDIIKDAVRQLEEFKREVEYVDPASLAPGGPLAACATMYTTAVVGKLKGVGSDVEAMGASMAKLAQDAAGPLGEIQKTMDSAMDKLEAAIKGLAKLPKSLATELNGKDSPDDIAKINTDGMRKALKGGDLDGPLGAIKGITSILTDVVSVVEKGIGEIQEFLGSAPDKLRAAFAPPAPLCCCKVTPQALDDLLKKMETLASIDFASIVTMLQKAAKAIGDIDVSLLKEPMDKFMASAGGLVDKIENTVKGAKMSTGGGMGGLKKMF